MASPQTSNGFAPIANELLDAFLAFGLNRTQIHIVLWVIRKTFGWNRKWTEFSWHAVARDLDMSRSGVTTEGKKLLNSKICHVRNGVIGIQKDYEKWTKGAKRPFSGRAFRQVKVQKVENQSQDIHPNVQRNERVSFSSLNGQQTEHQPPSGRQNVQDSEQMTFSSLNVQSGEQITMEETMKTIQDDTNEPIDVQATEHGAFRVLDVQPAERFSVELNKTQRKIINTTSLREVGDDLLGPKPKTPLQQVMNHYILAKGLVLDKEKTRSFYDRFGKAAKGLLKACEMNPEQAKKKIDEIGEYLNKTGLSWTLDTITKWTCDPSLMNNQTMKNGTNKESGEAAPIPGKYAKFC